MRNILIVLFGFLTLGSSELFGQIAPDSIALRLPPIYYNPIQDLSDYVDIIYLSNGVSLSLEGGNAKYIAGFIDTIGVTPNIGLKPLAHASWTSKGKGVRDAFIYLDSTGVGYFEFTIDNKKYYNKLKPYGYNFIAKYLNQGP